MKDKAFSITGSLLLYFILVVGLCWFAVVGLMWILYLFMGDGGIPNDLYRIPGL